MGGGVEGRLRSLGPGAWNLVSGSGWSGLGLGSRAGVGVRARVRVTVKIGRRHSAHLSPSGSCCPRSEVAGRAPDMTYGCQRNGRASRAGWRQSGRGSGGRGCFGCVRQQHASAAARGQARRSSAAHRAAHGVAHGAVYGAVHEVCMRRCTRAVHGAAHGAVHSYAACWCGVSCFKCTPCTRHARVVLCLYNVPESRVG